MANAAKARRMRAAQLGAAERYMKRALSLTVAVLRAKTLMYPTRRNLALLSQGGRTRTVLRAASAATERVQLTPLARLDSYYSVYLGLLYAVVEKWLEWRFADSRVDGLLTSREVELLKRHRHAVFHAEHYDAKAIRRIAADATIVGWATRLQRAIETFLRRWHADPERHVLLMLTRIGT